MLSIEQRVMKVIDESAVCAEGEVVVPGSHFRDDLGLDSLDHAELRLHLEEEFGIEIPDHDAHLLPTVQAAVDYITARAGTKPIAHHPV